MLTSEVCLLRRCFSMLDVPDAEDENVFLIDETFAVIRIKRVEGRIFMCGCSAETMYGSDLNVSIRIGGNFNHFIHI